MDTNNIFDFPPFFTRQPNQDTWNKQQDLWLQVIMTFCKTNKIYQLPVNGQVEPFTNQKIKSIFIG